MDNYLCVWCDVKNLCVPDNEVLHISTIQSMVRIKKRANSWLYSTNIKISELKINAIAKRVVRREAMGLHR